MSPPALSMWKKFKVTLLIAIFLTGGLAFFINKRYPLLWYGVHTRWDVGGTGAYPFLKVWTTVKGQRVEISLGMIENATVSYRDVDGDGIPDIIFGTAYRQTIVAFKPNATHPEDTFVIIKDESGL